MRYIDEISDFEVGKMNSFTFTMGASVYLIDTFYIPIYSKGIFVCSGYDAIVIAIDANGNLYTAFRNNTTWTYCVKR